MDDKLVRFFNKIGFNDIDSFKDSKVTKVTINKLDETWNVYITNKRVVNINSVIKLMNIAKKGIEDVKEINIIFDNEVVTEDSIIEYFRYILNELVKKSPSLLSIINKAIIL